MELKFIPVSFRTRTSPTKINRVFDQVKAWDYTPSTRCIQETFNLSYSSAHIIFKRLIKEKGITRELRQHLHEQKHRSVLKKILRNLYAEQVFSAFVGNLPLTPHEPTKSEIEDLKDRGLISERKTRKTQDIEIIDITEVAL